MILTAYDVFIFAKGIDFEKQEENFREGRFFLNPIPFLGAFNKISNKNLNIKFISLFKDNKAFFKLPLDIKRLKEKKDYISPKLKKASNIISKEPIEYILDYNTQEKIQDPNEYVDSNIMLNYLTGKSLDISEENMLKTYEEIRTGIEIDNNTKTTVEGALFTQIFTRFDEGVGVLVKFDEDVNVDCIPIGGEGKVFKVVSEDVDVVRYFNDAKDIIKQYILKTSFFKIILLSPTNGIPNIEGAKLTAKMLGKPLTFSGWFRNRPTRVFKLMPEGSVFYYKLEDKSKLEHIFERFWFRPSFLVKEYPYFDTKNTSGFGLTTIGVVKEEDIL
ncbi:MAG: type III-B CRISPR module-associated Cmr3 family protein [Hydrogenobaculum sp.]